MLSPLPNLQLRRIDFREVPLRDADAVVCYLCPSLMVELAPKMRTDLPLGAQVISLAFALPRWKPETETHLEDLLSTCIYGYRA